MTSRNPSCPIGEHYVKDHTRRTKKSGIVPVSAHCRKNPKGKEKLLYASNLRHIYYSSGPKKYPKLPAIKGFRGFHQYDPMIQSWNKEGEGYAKKVYKYYNETLNNK